MIAVDTNLLARFYVDDTTDPEASRQRSIAHRVLAEADSVFVPITVVLELEWVVRALYDFAPVDFARVLGHLAALPNVVVEDRSRVFVALGLHLKGLDFADALHLSRGSHCDRLVTFDRAFARRARRLGTLPPAEVAR